MRSVFTLSALILLFLLNFSAHAEDKKSEVTYGPELELTNEDLMSIGSSTGSFMRRQEGEWAMRLGREIEQICKAECKVTLVDGKWGREYRVTFASGYYFQISWDPAVVEILAKPATLAELHQNAENMHRFLHEPARKMGLYGSRVAAGHLNMGFGSAFHNDPELFLNFFVDYANHPELALGILGHDIYNGPPLSILRQSQRDALSDLIRRFYQKKYKSAQDVASAIENRVYTKSSFWFGAKHYQSMGLKSMREEESSAQHRVEFRSAYSQDNFGQFILFAELIEKRRDFLEENKDRIIYLKSDETSFTNQQLVNLFWIYLNEMGVEFKTFRPLLKPEMRDLKPQIIFKRPIRWESETDRNEILWWAGQSLKSPFIRDLLIKVLGQAASHEHEMPLQVMQKVAEMVAAREVVDEILNKIIKNLFHDIINKVRRPDLRNTLLMSFVREKQVRSYLNLDKIYFSPQLETCEKYLGGLK